MFHEDQSTPSLGPRWAIAALALLSLTALLVTAWILADFASELEILEQLSRHLPSSDLPEATELAGELRFQSRLSLVLILNTVASTVAMSLLIRAYLSSESSLRETKVLATDILASLDQGIITTDQNAKILSINPCGEELLEQSMAGEAPGSMGFPAAHLTLAQICQQVLETRQGVRDKDYVAKCNGHDRTLRVACSLLRDHRQRQIGAVVSVRDVTEKALIEQRLRTMQRYMSLGSLAAGLQHEIKNPLSALALHVQLLREAVEEEHRSPEIRAGLDVLQHETRRITDVLETFRDFASIGVLNRSNVDPVELVTKTARLVEPQANEQGVRIQIDAPAEQPRAIHGDSARMEQVLLNLVLNALAATPNGGDVRIQVEQDTDSVMLSVVDSGPGIPKDLEDKVFDPYFTTRSTGTGMGLAICEKIVSQHDGSIEFQTGSRGTRFTVSLPAPKERGE